MCSWKADGATAIQMAGGFARYVGATMHRILEGLVPESDGIEARTTGSSASSKDPRSRSAIQSRFDRGDCWIGTKSSDVGQNCATHQQP
jgi:hypothetical protein